MNYSKIKYCDIANGTGVRTTLFVSGCRVHCPGCFNTETWDFAGGEPFDETVCEQIWESIDHPWIEGLTVLGGEPFEPENQAALRPFLEETRRRFPNKSIWCFSGYRYDQDIAPENGRKHTQDTNGMLDCIDVLVDGPFIQDEYDITLRFHGSANQRLIDMAATRAAEVEALAAGADPRSVEPVLWTDQQIYSTHTV